VLGLFTFRTKHIARLEKSTLTSAISLLWTLVCVIHENTECYELLGRVRNLTYCLEWRPLLRHRIGNTLILKWTSERMKILTGFIWLRIGAGIGLL
jgi:hypothetical protein